MTQVLGIKKGILFKAFAGLFEVSSLKIEKWEYIKLVVKSLKETRDSGKRDDYSNTWNSMTNLPTSQGSKNNNLIVDYQNLSSFIVLEIKSQKPNTG